MDFRARIRRGLGIATGRSLAISAGFTIRESDVFLVSYPKSGNTWARFLLANALCADGVDFVNIDKIIPDIYKVNLSFIEGISQRRIIKSHSPFNPAYPKVIYIVRNPLDVAVSYYFFNIKMGYVSSSITMDEYIDRFIFDSGEFGTWEQNVKSWICAMSGKDGFMLVKYEDMLTDTLPTLERILDFADLKPCRDVNDIILSSSFENMKSLEKKQHFQWRSTKFSNPKIPFVRKGKNGSWREELSSDSIEKIVTSWADLMDRLGYRINF
ncbi:MAG: sulfotransferase domain-containing protein [Novosphingobium sp.]